MNKIKGIATIEIFDNNKQIVNRLEENLITNNFKNLVEVASISARSPLSKNPINHSNTLKSLQSLKSTIGGLLLFEDKIEANENILHYKKMSSASAGSVNNLTDPLKGTLNASESGEYTIDGKNAYRWVWEFGTSNANFEINTLALSTLDAGDRYSTYRDYGFLYQTKAATRICSHESNAINSKGQMISSKMDSNTIIVSEKKNTISFEDNISSIYVADVEKSIDGYINLSNNLYIENNKLHLIAQKTSDNKYYFLTINDETFIVESEHLLVNFVPNKNRYFMRVGKDEIWYNLTSSSSKLFFKSYNLSTDSIDETNYSLACGIYRTGYGEFLDQYNYTHTMMSFVIFKTNKDEYATCIHNTMFEIGNPQRTTNYFFSKTECYWKRTGYSNNGVNRPIISTDINKGIVYNTTSNKDFGIEVYPFFIGPEPLFTINTLSNPIIKTGANTMKISYTLIYD